MEADFQQFYNIDLESGILKTRTWRWFRVKVMGLLDMPPVYDPRDNNKPHHQSRLGRKMHPAE